MENIMEQFCLKVSFLKKKKKKLKHQEENRAQLCLKVKKGPHLWFLLQKNIKQRMNVTH